MAELICPGSCNGSYRRVRAVYEAAVKAYAEQLETRADNAPVPEPPKAPEIKPWNGEPVWCRKCQAIIRAELAELDDLVAIISTLAPLARVEDNLAGRVSGSRDARSASPRLDDAEELNEWLRSWEGLARGGDTLARRGHLATETTTIVAWLVAHLDPLLASEDYGQGFGEEVRRWHRALAGRASAAAVRRHMKKPCPRCRLYTLWLIIGDDYIRCVNGDCGRAMTREEFDGLTAAA